MPKILIKEEDRTSPGAPSAYANITVLIPGFMGTPSTKKDASIVEPDFNGVYEFSSANAFEDTIGLVARTNHYGNQMAYELLKLGYPILYKPIGSIADLTDSATWKIFKDKANYDFRFITHGLLRSSTAATERTRLGIELTYLDEANNYLTHSEGAVQKAYKAYIDGLLDTDEYSGKSEKDIPSDVLQVGKDLCFTETFMALDDDPSAEQHEGNLHIKNTIIKYATSATPLYNIPNDSELNCDSHPLKLLDFSKVCKIISEAIISVRTNINLLAGYYDITREDINKANTRIAEIAEYHVETAEGSTTELPGRGDCVALIELDEASYLNTDTSKPEIQILDAINADCSWVTDVFGKYCALTVPSVCYKMTDYSKIGNTEQRYFDNNKKFPGAFHYLACFINSLQKGFSEWYAAAGYTRGVSSYIVDYTTVKLGEIAINTLEPRNWNDPQTEYPKFACNIIANFRGSYYLWGNRTAHPLGKVGDLERGDLVASHFLNIRQLCSTIKKQLYVSCRRFTFDPNSDTLWVNFVNAIKPTLEAMKADQGIRDYKILKEYTDKKATLKAKIRIIPIEAVEDFDLTISLEDSFGETNAVITD